MSIVEFLSQPLWQRLGLTLVHFLWQGLAVAVLVGVLVRVFRLKHGNARYTAYVLAFIAMVVCPVVTFTAIDIPISPNTELVTGVESAEVVETFSYAALPAGDILPEAEPPPPAMPTLADSIPLGQRISDWLNVSMPWVLVIWMVGVIVLSVRLLMGFVGVYRWRHHLEPLPERLVQRIVSLSERLRMRGFSRVFISPTVLQAMAVGYLRPMVLLPAAMVAQMQPEMLEAVIAHELAHIRRFDLWVNLIQRVTETLLFYHPAVWWLSNCIRRERELCCDELAVKATGERLTYATTLESVGRARFVAKPPVLATGLGQDNKPTLGRVRHILGLDNKRKDSRFWLAGVIAVLLIMAIIIPTGFGLIGRLEDKPAVQVSAQELVAKIIESERRIEDIQLHMTCTIPARNLVFYEYDWGYDSGKEFYAGFQNSTKPGRNEISRTTQITRAFDGQNEWSLRVSSEDKQPRGAIFKPSFSLRSTMTFNTLLGFDAKERSRLSFGEAIAQAESISVRDKVEFIDGHPCYVIEAVNLVTDTSVNWAYDVRAWIDYQRDYRLLKFEKYRSISGKNRFKVVSRRVDNIKLIQVDGIWLPIEGSRTTFSTNDYGPPKGMTLAQFAALPMEEQKQVGVFKLTPMAPPRRLEVDVKSIRLNKGIPPERFTVAFPDGCEVYNEFTGKRYVVGEPSEREVAFSDAEWIEQMAGLSVGELIVILRDSRIGNEKKKWFAAVHRLVEIGSTAVPELVTELRRTEKPQTQSKLALTLRAIGDPNAVPGLIDGLERSGFSSDYGIGYPRTELDMFFKQHQLDPARKSLGLARAVREITIAIEKLTGHTEGHEHFHAYDLKYDRLGSYTITPEIRDRQRQHRRQVAERWRKWWQANKDNIKPIETLPKPPAEPKPARSEKLEQMIMAAPEGSILTLAIVPNVDGSGRRPSLTKEEYQRHVEDLARNGPFAGSVRGESFQWSPIKGDSTRFKDLPLSAYKDRNYLLLCARAQYVMVPELEGKLAWGLEKVETTQDGDGKPTISIQFDEKGSELLYELTRANIGNHLAIAVDSWVLSAPTIETPLTKRAIITGDFTEQQMRTFVEDLRKGMTPVDQQTIKAMRLIAEAADKLNKQDVAKMGPRRVVENLFVVGLSGNVEKLTWFFRPGSAADGVFSVRDFAQMADGHKIKVLEVYADSSDALAITSNIKGKSGDQEGQLVFYLSNQTGTWLIYDLDVGEADRVRENLTEFLSTHSAVQVEGGEINVETLLNKVRQAQRPTENMIVEWQSEKPQPGFSLVPSGSRKPDFSPPSRILQTYKAIIAGDKSRIEERELTFQSQKDTEPSRIREITYVFDGTTQKQLDHFVKGFENEYRGYRHTYDKNTQLLLKLLLAYPPYLDSPELQEKYNLKVIENKEKGLITLETSKENSGIHRYTIDPDKDYNIVKQEVILPRGTDYEINCIVKKQANGSWYQVAREKIRYSVKTGKPSLENKVKITKLDFKPEIPTDAFELQFPKGIKIWDGSLKDWVIVGDEEEASRETYVQVDEEASTLKLKRLGTVLLAYAKEHDGEFPSSYPVVLPRIKRELGESDFSWYVRHIKYIGKHKRVSEDRSRIIAYNKIMLKQGEGTDVLFPNGDVGFIEAPDLKSFGLKVPGVKEESAEKLMQLGIALLIYARDHEGVLPSEFELDPIRQEMSDSDFRWCLGHAEYIGQGKKPSFSSWNDRTIEIAYDKTLLRQGEGTNVLFMDCRVEFLGLDRLEELGIPAFQVEGGKSLEDRREEFRKQAREDLHQEMKKKNAREFAEAYVTALKNKDWNLAASMCRPGSKQARNAHLLGKMCDFNDIDIETVYANKKIALAVTEGLRLIDGRKSQLGITLRKESLGWIVKDLDWLPPDEEEKFLKEFVETFPDAKVISKKKPAVQVEGEQSDESAGNVVLPSKDGSEAKSSEGLTLNQGREGSISGKVVGRRIFYQKPESLGRNVLPENFERQEDSPLPGVKIFLRKDKKAHDKTNTDETGHYAFEGLHPGHYTVWALKPGGTAIEMVWTVPMAGPGPWEDHGSSYLRRVEVKSEPQTDVDLHFRLDGVSIAGRVTDDNGNPVSGAGVVIELCTPTKDGGEGRSGAYSKIKIWYGMIRTKTDKNGRFKLDGLCPVTFSEIADYLMGGEPYRRYEVRVQAEDYSPARILVPPVTEHLASETSRLVEDHKRLFRKQDSLVDEVDLPKSQGSAITGIDLVLQKQAVVAGRVLDTQGNILPGPRPKASVRLVCVDSSDDKGESLLVQMPDRAGLNWIALDETGRFRIDAVPPGNYLFEVDTIEHRNQRATNEPFTVSAGQVINDIKVIVPNEKTDAPVEVEGAWGEAVEGVQMRVRPKRQVWYEGETPKFMVDMRNKGIVEWKLGLTQSNWEVELDGLWHRVGVLSSHYPRTLLFGPGQEHKDIEFYPGVWSDWNINGRPLKFTPGLHTVRLSFVPSTRYSANLRRLRVVSNAVVIEVLPAEADKRDWGEAVAGLQCGLRADKRLWKADETPRLQAVARNVGRDPWRLPEFFFLKVAGKIWRWKGPGPGEPVELKPGEDLDKTTILLSSVDWVPPYESDLRLKLSPGKHIVQLVIIVSVPVPPEVFPVVTIPVSKQLRIESNVVVIEVLPTGSDVEQKTDVQIEAATQPWE